MGTLRPLLFFGILACAIVVGCARPAGLRYPGLPSSEQGALHVVNFSVGQSDALLIIYRGKTMLIDCGSPTHVPLMTSRRIPRRLDALLGTRHIDYFVITHYHQDHMGVPARRGRPQPSGIYALIERDGVTIDTIIDRGDWFIGTPGATHRHYRAHVQKWIDRGVVKRRRTVTSGDSIDMGEGLEVAVVTASGNGVLDRMHSLYPKFMARARPSENDYSVGVKVTLGDFEMFSAGDLSGVNVMRVHGPSRETYNDIELGSLQTSGLLKSIE